MNKVLIYSERLDILYIENNRQIEDDIYNKIKPFFNKIDISPDIEQYIKTFDTSSNYPNIVIIDAQDNWASCIETIEKIKKINISQSILIINSDFTIEQLKLMMSLKVLHYLYKPFEFKALYSVIYEVSKEIYDNSIKDDNIITLHNKVKNLNEQIELSKSQKELKDNFFANISHEIRTPINAVIGLSHILLESNLNEKHYDYIEKIQTSGNLILNIINDILDFSKIEAGKLTIEYIEFDINTVLENTSTMISFKADEKNIELIFDMDNSIPHLMKGDSLRLSQVLINLMSNAVKFTKQGEVKLSAKVLDSKKSTQLIEFRVSDTGIGLSQKQIDGLFQSFTQATSSTSREYGGTGLGLSISKQLVELMGGSIRAESNQNKGSDFIFTIQTEILEKTTYNLPSVKMMNKKVLIIDTNISTTKALKRILQNLSYTILKTTSQDKIEEQIENEDFDILFIEKKMFIEYEEKVLKNRYKSKIVLMHSSLNYDWNVELENVKIDAHLIKPFHNNQILSTIFKIFSKEDRKFIDTKKTVSKDILKPLSGSHILLVEDNKINQSVILALLENTGIKITIANNGEETLDIIDTLQKVDLILMDLEMPIMDGYTTVSKLKEKISSRNIPILALSGNASDMDKEKTKDAGMNGHLSKPLDVNYFYNSLVKFISVEVDMKVEYKYIKQEFKELLLDSKYYDMLELAKKIENLPKYRNIKNDNIRIQNIILKYKKIFLVLINNFDKDLNIFMLSVENLIDNNISNVEKEKILNIKHKNIKPHYKNNLKSFCSKFEGSILILQNLVKKCQFEEAIVFSSKIKQEAEDLNIKFIYQSLTPIMIIEKTQYKLLNKIISEIDI